jgi:uncharacterized protein
MEWLNEPASWQRTGDVLTVSVDPGTDFWRETGYGYIRDSGHVYGEVLAGDLDVSVRIRGVLAAQYDQAGVMLRADEQTWLKTGIEFFEGRPRLSTVLTLGRSSWMVTDLPAGLDDILLRVSRRGDAVEVRYLIGEGQAELAALVYMPPGAQVLAGVMAAAPEGPGFRISFHDLHVTERDWSAEAGDDVAAGDWAGEPAWTGDGGGAAWPLDEEALDEAGADAWSGENGAPSGEPSSWESQEPAPAWDSGQPESDRPGWASGAASADHPSWPAGTTPLVNEADWAESIPEEDDPDWPKKLAMEDDPDWPKKLAMEDDPSWATEIGVAEPKDSDPSWTSGAGPAEPRDSDSGRATRTGTDAAGDSKPGDDNPGQAGGPAAEEESGGGAPATNGLVGPAGPPAGPEPPLPGQSTEANRQAWAPAPTMEDAVADWDRLAAGAQTGSRIAHAERWAAQVDADVANEWPGPPLRAARLAAISGSLMPAGQPGPDPGAPATKEPAAPAEPGALNGPAARAEPGAPAGPGTLNGPGVPAESEPQPDSRAEGEPADGQDGSGQAQAAPDEPGRAKWRKAAARPPLDLPGPPDPADEWISLLTADPADE